jgi:Fe-S-cluster-containing hydrogenase component 2
MAGSFAVAAALPGVLDVIPSRDLVRPPGALEEEQFARTCIRCGACTEACPVHGIGIAHITDGLQKVGTPVLSGYCMVFKGLENPDPSKSSLWKQDVLGNYREVTCFECISTCPSGALQKVEPSQLHMGTAVVRKQYCRFWRFGSCGYPCASVCPFDAITISSGPHVDETKCVGCGQCDFVCLARETGPTGIMVEPRQG